MDFSHVESGVLFREVKGIYPFTNFLGLKKNWLLLSWKAFSLFDGSLSGELNRRGGVSRERIRKAMHQISLVSRFFYRRFL